MTSFYHREEHFNGNDTIRDIVIGMSDGLTVPFALAAGISGAIAQTHLVVTAGFAEIAAGSIAMGLGGYLAAKSDGEHYASESKREEQEIVNRPQDEVQEIYDIFSEYGVTEDDASAVVAALQKRPEAWRDFMMKFELGLEKPNPSRALKSALTIAGSYILGGIIPLFPYIVFHDSDQALMLSAISNVASPFQLWVYQRTFYVGLKDEKRFANGLGRRSRSQCRIRPGKSHLLTELLSPVKVTPTKYFSKFALWHKVKYLKERL